MTAHVPTFVVNLRKDIFRREWMESQLRNEKSLAVNFIDAVDGRLIGEDYLKSIYDRSFVIANEGRDFTRDEIGCSLSHNKIYREIIEKDINFALILEDDAWLSPHISDVVLEAISKIDSEEPAVILLTVAKSYLSRPTVLRCGSYDVKLAYQAWGTLGYLINKSAAKKISEINMPVRYSADSWWVFRRHAGIKIMCFTPILVIENSSDHPSIIEAERSKLRGTKLTMASRLRRLKVKIIMLLEVYLWIKPFFGIERHSKGDIDCLASRLKK